MRWFDRLARSSEIAYVRRTGHRTSAATFTAYVSESRSGRTSVAIAVSKSVGIAVVRNRIRRRIFGALDALGREAAERSGPHRIFFVIRPQAATAGYDDLARDVARCVASAPAGSATAGRRSGTAAGATARGTRSAASVTSEP